MTGEIFISLPAFYQSTMILDLQSIRLKEYTKFVTHHFQKNGKYINKKVLLKWDMHVRMEASIFM